GDPYNNRDGEIVTLGNTFSNSLYPPRMVPYEVGSLTRLREVDDTLNATVADPAPLLIPPVPQNQNRAVFEPASHDSAGIQASVYAAAGSTPRAIVHLPYGAYTISQTIEVPANVTI